MARAFNDQGNWLGKVAIDLHRVPAAQLRAWEVYPRSSGAPYQFCIWQQEVTIYQSIRREAIIGWRP